MSVSKFAVYVMDYSCACALCVGTSDSVSAQRGVQRHRRLASQDF